MSTWVESHGHMLETEAGCEAFEICFGDEMA